MRIEDEAVLREMRGPGRCEWCGAYGPHREAAHILARGLGSGSRLDIPLNLVSLGIGGWVGYAAVCVCHNDSHNGKRPTTEDLLTISGKKVGATWQEVRAVLWMLKRIPKSPTAAEILREMEVLSEPEKVLAMRTIDRAQKHFPEGTWDELAAKAA